MVDQLGRVAGELQRREPELEVEHARDFAAALISDGLLVALHEHGWSVEAPPAEPVLCCRGDRPRASARRRRTSCAKGA